MVVLTPPLRRHELGLRSKQKAKITTRPLLKSAGAGVSRRKGRRSSRPTHHFSKKRSRRAPSPTHRSGRAPRDIATQIAIGALRYFMLKYDQAVHDRLRFQRSAPASTAKPAPMRNIPSSCCHRSIFKKAGIDPENFCSEVARNLSTGKELSNYLERETRLTKFGPTKSGSCGWRPPRLPQ